MDTRFFSFLMIAGLLLAAPMATYAGPCTTSVDLCDDIDTIASGWASVADALEQNADDDIGDLDVERLEEDVNTLLEPTRILGEALIEMGNEDEGAMGDVLLGLLDELVEVSGEDMAAYLVDIMDDITEVMDFIVAYCDERR